VNAIVRKTNWRSLVNILSKGDDALISKRPPDRSIAQLDELSARTRELILRSVFNAGAGHIGGPLSVTDILVNLYFDRVNIEPLEPHLAGRDRVILSKGHSSIALYTVLALRGYFPVGELDTFDAIDSRLQGHPCMKTLPGVDMSTGSLGQGLSPGVGMALGAKRAGLDFHTWVILGDGEIQEGQIWEACFVAARYALGNLTVILDYNKLPQFGWPSEQGYDRNRPIDDPAAKFAAFGWATIECDGHDHESLRAAFDRAESATNQPVAIIANTIKGKGVSFMEANHNWHAKVPTQQELDDAVAELSQSLLAGVGPA
jgi:transketolase